MTKKTSLWSLTNLQAVFMDMGDDPSSLQELWNEAKLKKYFQMPFQMQMQGPNGIAIANMVGLALEHKEKSPLPDFSASLQRNNSQFNFALQPIESSTAANRPSSFKDPKSVLEIFGEILPEIAIRLTPNRLGVIANFSALIQDEAAMRGLLKGIPTTLIPSGATEILIRYNQPGKLDIGKNRAYNRVTTIFQNNLPLTNSGDTKMLHQTIDVNVPQNTQVISKANKCIEELFLKLKEATSELITP